MGASAVNAAPIAYPLWSPGVGGAHVPQRFIVGGLLPLYLTWATQSPPHATVGETEVQRRRVTASGHPVRKWQGHAGQSHMCLPQLDSQEIFS